MDMVDAVRKFANPRRSSVESISMFQNNKKFFFCLFIIKCKFIGRFTWNDSLVALNCVRVCANVGFSKSVATSAQSVPEIKSKVRRSRFF